MYNYLQKKAIVAAFSCRKLYNIQYFGLSICQKDLLKDLSANKFPCMQGINMKSHSLVHHRLQVWLQEPDHPLQTGRTRSRPLAASRTQTETWNKGKLKNVK